MSRFCVPRSQSCFHAPGAAWGSGGPVGGGGEEAATTLWKGCGVKVLPGAYLAQAEPDGANPGKDYVRVALVHYKDTTREALTRIVATLG